jgi:hypothetical protein
MGRKGKGGIDEPEKLYPTSLYNERDNTQSDIGTMI